MPVNKIATPMLFLFTLIGTTIANAQVTNSNADAGKAPGAVFAMTNRSSGNGIIAYNRMKNGKLTRVSETPTRGRGIGTDLDAQGPLRLSADHRFLYACNAGSDDITVFTVDGTTLTFVQKIYAGDEPVSLTLSDNLLYVLNGSVAGNGIRGFSIASNGTLTSLPNSIRLLSSNIAVPGDVEFSPDGRVLLVTHKSTDLLVPPQQIIDAFTIGNDGLPSAKPKPDASHGIRPFSLTFRNDGILVVAESFNARPGKAAASSYQLLPDGNLAVISGSVHNFQMDSCWVVITNDGRYAYTANFGSGTISSFSLSTSGILQLMNGNAAFLGAVSQPVDLGLSIDGQFLYLLLRGTGGVAAFHIRKNGSLEPLGIVVGALPVADGASGLAAY